MKYIVLILMIGCGNCSAKVISQWRMNDNTFNTYITDSVGFHPGTFKGETYTTVRSTAGKFKLCYDLDGTNDYVEIADATMLSPSSTSMSISAWINMDVVPFYIASKYEADNVEWSFYTNDGAGSGVGNLEFLIYDQSAVAVIGRKYNTVLSMNTWLHVVGTYKNDATPTSADIKLYLNGVKVDDTDENDGGVFEECENLNAPVHIGKQIATYANGKIDDVIIYDHVLTLAEIKALYNSGMGTESVGLHIDYRNRYKF